MHNMVKKEAKKANLLNEEEDDLLALSSTACDKLVTLTEEPYQHELLARLGVEVLHFPIDDMRTPRLTDARRLCETVSTWVDQGRTCVFHCKAGLGRTGTMLACVLVYRSQSAVSAVDTVRGVNPYYIQSTEQLEFVTEFQHFLDPLVVPERSSL